jgi:hypothetical protein
MMMGFWLIYSSIFSPSSLPTITVGMVTECPLPSSIITTSSGRSILLSMMTAILPPYFWTLIDFCVKVQSLR